jgi:hypothetical protein
VLQDVFIFFEYRYTILLRGAWWIKWKMSIWENSKIIHKQQVSAGHCPAPPDIVWNSNMSPTARFLGKLYKYPSTSNVSLSLGHCVLLLFKLISFISKGPNHSPLELLFQVLHLGIGWRKDSSSLCNSPSQAHLGCWIFILHAYYSWSFAPRQLEVALELPLYVVSLGKFVLPFFVIVSSSNSSLWSLEWGKGWEKPGSLWTPQWGHRILCESKSRD